MGDTRGQDYTKRLQRKSSARWKKYLNVQAPYRLNLRRNHLGVTLDVGCGIGRNLAVLPAGSMGVDHNADSVEAARSVGLDAVTTLEWESHPRNRDGAFDGLLVAHVLEHMDRSTAVDLLRRYVPALRPGGRALLICPQERGYASDGTHVNWLTGEDLERVAGEAGLAPQAWRSFPFPRSAGRWFAYNEFTVLATIPVEG